MGAKGTKIKKDNSKLTEVFISIKKKHLLFFNKKF